MQPSPVLWRKGSFAKKFVARDFLSSAFDAESSLRVAATPHLVGQVYNVLDFAGAAFGALTSLKTTFAFEMRMWWGERMAAHPAPAKGASSMLEKGIVTSVDHHQRAAGRATF